jgi:hypothetical protein
LPIGGQEKAPREKQARPGRAPMSKMKAAAVVALLTTLLPAGNAAAQVRDAVYRGTVVCEKLPFLNSRLRLSMLVTVKGKDVTYTRPVVMKEGGAQDGMETGKGIVDGNKISLVGGWQGAAHGFEATYSGTFVRRSAKLAGKQTWKHEGKTYERTCSGSIKRPLAIFLKKEKS